MPTADELSALAAAMQLRGHGSEDDDEADEVSRLYLKMVFICFVYLSHHATHKLNAEPRNTVMHYNELQHYMRQPKKRLRVAILPPDVYTRTRTRIRMHTCTHVCCMQIKYIDID